MFSFISHQITSGADNLKLSELFVKLDKNGDGNLSAQEINEGYDLIGVAPPPPVQDLIKKVSSTGGNIFYQDFVDASNTWNKVIQQKELEVSFKKFIKGADAKLSLDELRQAIPGIETSN